MCITHFFFGAIFCVCDMTHLYVWQDCDMICVMWKYASCASHMSCHSRVTYMNESCHPFETDSCVWHDCDMIHESKNMHHVHHTWMGHVTHTHPSRRDGMTHSYVWHDCDMTVTHDYDSKGWHTYEWVMSNIWIGQGTHMNESCRRNGTLMNESCHTYEWVMSNI